MGIDVHPKAKCFCKYCLKGRGNSELINFIGFRATFQEGEPTLVIEAPPPALWLMPTVPNN
jgi:hypothetical protein